MTKNITQFLCIAALLAGGLAFGATADASNCIDDQFSGVCLPLESAPAQPEAITLAQADVSCDQFSGLCETQETRAIEWQPAPAVAHYSPCDQFSGVCAEMPSSTTERAHHSTAPSGL